MAEVLGCRVVYSSLNEPMGLPFSVECTLEGGGVSGFSDVVRLVGGAASTLSKVIGVEARIAGFSGWEYLGGRFNLYTFDLESHGRPLGVIRLVESGGYPVNITGALTGYARLLSERLASAGPGFEAGEGYNLGITLLERPSSRVGDPPPGQKYIRDFVIYAVEGIQDLDSSSWRLRVTGAVERPGEYDLGRLLEMAEEAGREDFHCVTGWSVKGRRWAGVPLKTLLAASRPREGAGWLAALSSGGYSTVVPLDVAVEEGLLALMIDGRPLPREMGYPARLLLPSLYGWKHGKWLTEFRVLEGYEDGYWEALSYHERGLVALEERFKVRNATLAEEGRLLGRPKPIKPSQPFM